MQKIENIDKKLFMYALFDKELNKFDMILSGFNDEGACKFYIDQFNEIKKTIESYFNKDNIEKKVSSFIERIHNSCIYRIAEFDYALGSFINDKVFLVDLFDFEFNNESEDNKDVKKSSD